MKHESIRTTLLAMIAGVAVALSARADSETVGGVEWQYTLSDGKATITSGDDWSPAIPSSTAGALSIPSTLGGCPVVAIGYGAFYRCSSLTQVTIPDGVETLDFNAFRGCTGLTRVTLPASVSSLGMCAFYDCSSLAVVTLSAGLESIGEYAFDYCTSLTELTIPDGVTSVGEGAFWDCSALRTMSVPGSWYGTALTASLPSTCTITYRDLRTGTETIDGVTWTYAIVGGKGTLTGASPAVGELAIPATLGGAPVSAIADSVFSGATALTAVAIPDSVVSIGKEAFDGCTALAEVTIPAAVTDLGAGAFRGCTQLTSATILGNIGNNWNPFGYPAPPPFSDCNNLGSVVLGGCMTNIGDGMFAECRGLTNVVIGDSIVSIGSHAFYYCDELTSVAIPDSVTNIGDEAFSNCRGLTDVAIPDSVTSIGDEAFSDCFGLTQFAVAGDNPAYASQDGVLYDKSKTTLIAFPAGRTGAFAVPDGVTSIGDNAFYHCTGLTSVAIPDGVTKIGYSAFYKCTGLVSLELPGACYGTDCLDEAGVPTGCQVSYRGIEPLAIATESLPGAATGTAYAAALSATGGRAPYVWSSPRGGYTENTQESTHGAAGTARGWQGDDQCWDLALPFAFPFFGKSYTNAKINSNGAISFGSGSFTAYSYSESTFLANPIIAAMWKDLTTSSGNIYVQSGPESVTVRWSGVYYNGGAVDFAATLRADGTIVLSYGNGNASGGFVGISAGDGTTSLVSAKSNSGSLANAADIVFAASTVLPAWLELTTDGVLQGTPPEAGEFTFTAMVTDDAGTTASKVLTLAVESNGDAGEATATTPVPVPHAWLDANAADILAAAGGDHEAAAKAAAANGMPVWACYVAGLTPTDPAAAFKIKSITLADGEPVIEWEPDLGADRAYVVEGKASMEDEWGPCDATSRFFRVKVVVGEETPEPPAHKGVQLWKDGPYWAETNIGAESPEDYGLYFWWGDTVGYKREGSAWVASDGSTESFSFSVENTPTYGKSVSTLQSAGWIDAGGNLAPEHDAAQVHWGGGWRMPTAAELGELISNTTTTWTTSNGVYGRLVTGKGDYASASIFLPAAGYGYGTGLDYSGSDGGCWSSTPSSRFSERSWSLYFDSGNFFRDDYSRYYNGQYGGQSVRALRGFAE